MTPQPKRSETAPSMESPEEPAPVREFAGIPVLESTIRGDAVLSGPVSVAGPGRLTRRGDTRPLGAHLEDEKKASLHNPEPERESPATPGGDLRIENGGTPTGTFSSHRHRFLTILEDGKLRDLGCDVPVDGGVCGLTFEEAMEQAFSRWHYSHRRVEAKR